MRGETDLTQVLGVCSRWACDTPHWRRELRWPRGACRGCAVL